MTICIAAIAENSKIVAITDKMLTLPAPVATKYEVNENSKAIKLGSKVVGLFAGGVIAANEILHLAKSKIEERKCKTVLEMANTVAEAYKEHWQADVKNSLLDRFGLDLAVFMANQKNLDDELVKGINTFLVNKNTGVTIIVAGVDTQPHLYVIDNPGTVTMLDSVGYTCIGSGSQHATLGLIEAEYHAGFTEERSLYALIEAKNRAEYDPGVGKLCDIVQINDTYTLCDNERVGVLTEKYNKSRDAIIKLKEAAAKELLK